MCEPVTMSLLAAGTLFSAYGTYQQGQAAQDAARYNAQMAEYAAQDAERRGEEDALAVRRKAASLKSSQRVDLASRGLDIGYGTAQDLQDQTDFFGEQDVATARYNARTQAWSARAGGSSRVPRVTRRRTRDCLAPAVRCCKARAWCRASGRRKNRQGQLEPCRASRPTTAPHCKALRCAHRRRARWMCPRARARLARGWRSSARSSTARPSAPRRLRPMMQNSARPTHG